MMYLPAKVAYSFWIGDERPGSYSSWTIWQLAFPSMMPHRRHALALVEIFRTKLRRELGEALPRDTSAATASESCKETQEHLVLG